MWQARAGAELVLEHSLRKHSSLPVDITWMRAGAKDDPLTAPGFAVSEGPEADCWMLGRPIDQAWPKRGHGTPFSPFRMAVPELCEFQGKAIYLDVDMLLLGDIAELWRWPQKAPYLCNGQGRTEVALIECFAFSPLTWPSIDRMQTSFIPLVQLRAELRRMDYLDETLPWTWNSCDVCLPDARLIHYTSVPHQPYKPYTTVRYKDHPEPALAKLWHETHREAKAHCARS